MDHTLAEEFTAIQEASSFAALHHRHQERSDGTPYIAHPFRVCLTLRQVFGVDDIATLTASLLHDLIEDTGVDYDDILARFGEEVADLVAGMTKDMRLREEIREAAYDEEIKAGSWKLKAIKLADVFDNLCDSDSEKREKAVAKAERAIACAEGEEKLGDASAKVREAINDIREAVFAQRMLEEARAEGGEVEIKKGETWSS
ncbi:HD domain-containing protein [Verrucomicrobiales bacterium BCK34]|nr:HD domain-containing protein [Verrucomicrobiales bacterium BCK34]